MYRYKRKRFEIKKDVYYLSYYRPFKLFKFSEFGREKFYSFLWFRIVKNPYTDLNR